MAFIEVADYFTVFTSPDHSQALAPDVGLTCGLFTLKDWQVEVGFDYFGGFSYPWFFNAKAGIVENKLFANAPSVSFGIFGIGTSRFTNFNIFDAVIGKTLPCWLGGGRLFVGGYVGSHTLRPTQGGYMLGFIQSFCEAEDCCGVKYYKWQILADYASGRNFIGGGGAGIAYYFNPYVTVVTGPTWFNDTHILGRWKWTVQIDILFSIFK